MHLIARNKIASYIKQHPEAETSFLVWLKQFPYREGKASHKNIAEGSPAGWRITGESQLGNSIYKVRYQGNLLLKTAYIDWVGTEDEYRAHTQKELENLRALYPDMKVGHAVKTTIVTLQPPSFDELAKKREVKQTDVTVTDQQNVPEIIFDQVIDYPFKSNAEYETGLARAITLLNAEPITKEVEALIPKLVQYETTFIKFPELMPLAVIKLKMQEWQFGNDYPLDLVNLIGSKAELDQLLSGDKPLSKHATGVLYNYFKIDFMGIKA